MTTYPLEASSFDTVYERTFLCALSPKTWNDYARRMRKLIRPDGKLLGFFPYGRESEPPPYSLRKAQVVKLFGRDFVLTCDEKVTDSLPVFAGKEGWQEWTRSGWFSRQNKNRQGRELQNDREQNDRRNGLVIQQAHKCAADKSRNSKAGVEHTKRRTAFFRRNDSGETSFEQRILCAQADSPQHRADESKGESSEKDKRRE
jgi:hypothetical protein